LRVDPHAQYEIRAYGEVIAGMVKRVAPLSYEAWLDYDVSGARLSHGELEALRRFVAPDPAGGLAARPDAEPLNDEALKTLGLSARERRELAAKLVSAERPDFELDLGRMRAAEEVGREMGEAVPERTL